MGHKQSKAQRQAERSDENDRPSPVATQQQATTPARNHNGRSSQQPNISARPSAAGSATSVPDCPYFLAGYCRNGDRCDLNHGPPRRSARATTPASPAPAPPPPPSSSSPQAAPQATSQEASSPKTPKIRTEEQAILMAMLNSLKDSLQQAQTSEERRRIYGEMRKAADQFKAEQERLRVERRERASSQRGGSGERQLTPRGGPQAQRARGSSQQASTSPIPAVSPMKNVNFPVFPYESRRFGPRDDGDAREGGSSDRAHSEDRVECAICLCSYEELEDIMVLPCLHWFHARCGNQWLEKSVECPLCQFNVLQSLRDGVEVEGVRIR